jgi:ATP-binding cassette subfamily F protein 3
VFIKGRNGAGKSTLVKTILSQYTKVAYTSTIYDGTITLNKKLKIGEYNQEFDEDYLHLTLEEAVSHAYLKHGITIDDREVKKLLSQYLFNPSSDGKLKLSNLSGGQKARFQLIRMLIGDPNLLILDEPTNHLDLPSIEELENALLTYHGGLLYISHDTNFINHMSGEVIKI